MSRRKLLTLCEIEYAVRGGAWFSAALLRSDGIGTYRAGTVPLYESHGLALRLLRRTP